MTDKQCLDFIYKIAPIMQAEAKARGYKVVSPAIAQACCESRYGDSGLAKYNNLFGLKCGSSWAGASVCMKTGEEYIPNVHTTISANFRAYPDLESGLKGYYDFISKTRYAKVREANTPEEYLTEIKKAGYATSSTYVKTNMDIIAKWNLTQFDTFEPVIPATKGSSPKAFVDKMVSWLGCNEADGSHKKIIDIYNSYKPLPRGYKVKYTDSWCATTVSAAAISLGYTDIIPVECSCPKMVELLKQKGIWVENDAYRPKPGDIIFYDWNDSGKGDNVGNPDHVGVVEQVMNDVIYVIEGNYKDAVGRRTIAINGKYIRGYGTPKFAGATPAIYGKWYTVDTHKLNVRANNNSFARVIGTLEEGQMVCISETVGKWGKFVLPNGTAGWVSMNYLKEK